MVDERTRIRRHPERARSERAALDAVLDEAIVCHVGFQAEHGPVVIPMVCARGGDQLLIHGSPAAGTMRALRNGAPACVVATVLDGLVVSRSAFGHSINYRSAVLYGSFRVVKDGEKGAAARAVVEGIIPGRWDELHAPTSDEMRQTEFLVMDIVEWSVKVRSGPPVDRPEDVARAVWAGEIPLTMQAGEPIRDPNVNPTTPIPASVVARAATDF